MTVSKQNTYGFQRSMIMTGTQLWQEFCRRNNMDPATPVDIWAFGGAPDALAALVTAGIKTGTASAAALYELEGEPVPEAGESSVILDSKDQAVCVIQTTRVYTVPFCQVSADHAFREGEGDRSLAYWRQVHEEFFRSEYQGTGLGFNENIGVVCEEFALCYVPGESRS